MTYPGPWVTPLDVWGGGSAIAYPMGVDYAHAILASDPIAYYRTNGGPTAERWTEWHTAKVSGSALSWGGTHGAASNQFLRGVRKRDLSVVTIEDLQNFRLFRPTTFHPAIAAMPPDAVDIEYRDPFYANATALRVTCTPTISAKLLTDSLAEVFPSEPWTFAVTADADMHATALPDAPYYNYGFRDDYPIDPDTWATVLTGTVGVDGSITLDAPDFTIDLDVKQSMSVGIRATSTSSDPDEDDYRWMPRIEGLAFNTQFVWNDFRYIYDSKSTRGLRQRQTPAGNPDGWPLRARQNAGATGSWPLRQRQTGN